jgi:Carboxypeptidase regulatory-like domain
MAGSNWKARGAAALLAVFLTLPPGWTRQAAPPAGFGVFMGRVVDAEGRPLPGSRVAADVLGRPGGREIVTVADSGGNFRLGPVRAGKYVVHASDLGLGYPDNYFAFLAGPLSSAPQVLVGSREVVTGVTVRLTTVAASLRLNVIDNRTGRPLAAAHVRLCRLDAGPPACISTTVRPAQGKLTATVPSGKPLRIQISALGYKTWVRELRGRAELTPRTRRRLEVALVPLE